MIQTKNQKYKILELKRLKNIGIKLNSKMVKKLSERIKQVEKAGRGINFLIYDGIIEKVFDEIHSVKGEEHKFSLRCKGDIKIAEWNEYKAYDGIYDFWFEMFLNK